MNAARSPRLRVDHHLGLDRVGDEALFVGQVVQVFFVGGGGTLVAARVWAHAPAKRAAPTTAATPARFADII
jgi:hypothetical protein